MKILKFARGTGVPASLATKSSRQPMPEVRPRLWRLFALLKLFSILNMLLWHCGQSQFRYRQFWIFKKNIENEEFDQLL
jgi:hypothetical protein